MGSNTTYSVTFGDPGIVGYTERLCTSSARGFEVFQNLTLTKTKGTSDILRVGTASPSDRDKAQRAYVSSVISSIRREEQLQQENSSPSSQASIVDRDSSNEVPLISVNTDTYGTSQEIQNRISSQIRSSANGEAFDPSRSTGIIVKPNLRASLSITSVSGKVLHGTINNFFLTGVREDTTEKFQVVQTFGSDYIFFFNRKPLIYTINGIFYNTEDKQWKNLFRADYDEKFRGTELVKSRSKAIFSYDDVVRHGYLLNLSYNIDSKNPNAVPFSFSIFVIKESVIGLSGGTRNNYEDFVGDQEPPFREFIR